MEYVFDAAKNLWLKKARGISFEEIILLMELGFLADVIVHHDQKKYPGQKIYVVDVDGYAYLVPYEEKGETIELKTIYPSRKATKQFIALYEKNEKPS